MAIYDTMQFLRCPVATYCIGQAASMGAVLFAGGAPGRRFLLSNSRVLLHQPLISGVLEGRATDLSIEAREIIRLRKRLYEILSKHTGQPTEKIQRDSDRNLWLDAEEAVTYGLADKILYKAPENEKPSNDIDRDDKTSNDK
jgi:ATP-dependent Clp protease protease subunit